MNRIAMAATLLAATLAWAVPAHAQDFPSKPVKIVVPYAAGGGTDIVARILAQKLQDKWGGMPVIVENRAGAGGNIGIEAAARSDPDGYTVLIAPDFIASAPHVYKLNYDPMT